MNHFRKQLWKNKIDRTLFTVDDELRKLQELIEREGTPTLKQRGDYLEGLRDQLGQHRENLFLGCTCGGLNVE